jgi:tetrahydromethanopterin S-methyltransferase subunit G
MAENKMSQLDFWIRYFKEHINTIGCVELDALDCHEVLALLQELADKKVDKPNKMAEVADLFGKELGEEFTLQYGAAVVKAEFNFDGLCITTKNFHAIHANWLQHLLTGRAVIVNG